MNSKSQAGGVLSNVLNFFEDSSLGVLIKREEMTPDGNVTRSGIANPNSDSYAMLFFLFLSIRNSE